MRLIITIIIRGIVISVIMKITIIIKLDTEISTKWMLMMTITTKKQKGNDNNIGNNRKHEHRITI